MHLKSTILSGIGRYCIMFHLNSSILDRIDRNQRIELCVSLSLDDPLVGDYGSLEFSIVIISSFLSSSFTIFFFYFFFNFNFHFYFYFYFYFHRGWDRPFSKYSQYLRSFIITRRVYLKLNRMSLEGKTENDPNFKVTEINIESSLFFFFSYGVDSRLQEWYKFVEKWKMIPIPVKRREKFVNESSWVDLLRASQRQFK